MALSGVPELGAQLAGLSTEQSPMAQTVAL